MLTGVVAAKEQFSPGGENRTNLGCGTAPVASVGSGQFGAGERRSGHRGLPPSRHRCPGAIDPAAITAVFVASTLSDATPAASVPAVLGPASPRITPDAVEPIPDFWRPKPFAPEFPVVKRPFGAVEKGGRAAADGMPARWFVRSQLNRWDTARHDEGSIGGCRGPGRGRGRAAGAGDGAVTPAGQARRPDHPRRRATCGLRVSFAPTAGPGAVVNGGHLRMSLWRGRHNMLVAEPGSPVPAVGRPGRAHRRGDHRGAPAAVLTAAGPNRTRTLH